jgi:hypothetical protein
MAADSAKPAWPISYEPDPPPTSVGKMITVVALAIGVGVLGYYMLDGHTHTCEACGERWRHLGAFNLGDPGAHTCGKCGTVQWWKDGVPHVFRSVLRSPPPKIMPDTLVSRLQEFREVPRLALPSWPPKEPR